MMTTILRCVPITMAVLLSGTTATAYAEIYKWIDEKGQVHFSDKKHAAEEAKLLVDSASIEEQPNIIVLVAEADAMLGKQFTTPQGKVPAITAGQWGVGNSKMKTSSLLRFDFSPLIAHLRSQPQLQLFRARLLLFANLDEKLYGQGTANQELPGHSTKSGDNAFYLKPVHNSWQEYTVTWDEFYQDGAYTPAAVRKSPGVTAPGSGDQRDKNYEIDVMPIIDYINRVNLNTLSLEMSLQRGSRMAEVTFYSREAAPELRPRIEVELFDSNLNPQPKNH